MIKRTGTALLSALLLAACGQRGPLYLPEADRDVVVSPPAAPASAQASPADGGGATAAPASPPASTGGAAVAPADDPADEQKRGNTRGQ
jgi:predicted small lipoprotein YifL